MKKTLALILAIVMVFAFATTAFATETKDIVGTLNEDGNSAGLNSGAENLNSYTAPETTVVITATAGNTQHRYAVDIEYPAITIEVGSDNLVWNVKTLNYEQVNGEDAAATNMAFHMTITNYSDMPVTLNTRFQYLHDGDDAADNMDLLLYKEHVAVATDGTVTFTDDEGTVTDVTDTTMGSAESIAKAAIGKATEFPFSLVAVSDDWYEVINHYVAAMGNNTSYDIAKLVISISG